jgi:tryptophan synthase alpha chain
MSRIAGVLARLKSEKRKALIPYICAGDPTPAITVPMMHGLKASGADIIELGVPFSDPMADGPVIQRASERALKHGVSLKDVIAMVAEFRKTDANTPVVLMGYANPIEHMGTHAFADAAKAAGVDGVLVVDYPPEECEAFAADVKAHGLDPIFMLAPTSTDERIAQVARLVSGYLYYVSLKGVTGSATLDTAEVGKRIPMIKAHADIPVGVGFGIRDAAGAQAIAAHADAVVIGSRVIQEIEAGSPEQAAPRVGAWLATIRRAIDAVAKRAA